MDNPDAITLWIYGCISFFLLWISSEIIGASECEYTGVIHFVISGCGCLKGRKINVNISVTDHLISQQSIERT
jgi:hypothetical protein